MPTVQSLCSLHRRRRSRRGATMIESAIILPVVCIAIFALLDLGLASLRYNALCDAANHIARTASVHGSLIHRLGTPLGPAEQSGQLGSGSAVILGADELIPTITPADVAYRVVWLDGDNTPRDSVQVDLRYQHTPLLTSLLPWGTLELQAVSTMVITN